MREGGGDRKKEIWKEKEEMWHFQPTEEREGERERLTD